MLIKEYYGDDAYSVLFYGDSINLSHYPLAYYMKVIEKYWLKLYAKGYLTIEKGTEDGIEYCIYNFHYPLTFKELGYFIKVFKCIIKSRKFIKRLGD